MQRSHTAILVGVAVAAFLAPFSQTVYTPNLTEIGVFFHTNTLMINLSISLFTIVLATSQFIVGPLTDIRGRRAVLLPGLLLFVGGSIICLASSSIQWFLFGRFIQALGISTGSVVAAAVIGDLYPPDTRGQAMSTYQTMVFLGPVVGPVVGSLISAYLHWQWTFTVLALAGVLVFLYNRLILHETLPPDTIATEITWRTFKKILEHKASFAIIMLGFFQFYGYYIFLVFLPDLLTKLYTLPTVSKGFFFVPLTAGIVIGTIAGGKLQSRWNRRQILSTTSYGISCVVLLFWLFLSLHWLAIPVLLVFLIAYGVLLGSSLPAQSTVLVNVFNQEKATAMGVYNFYRFIGASIGPLLGAVLQGYFGDGGLFLSLGFVLLVSAVFIQKHMFEPAEVEVRQ